MKGRLLALLLSLIVSSTAGLYAKNAASTQDTSSGESTTSVETSSADSQNAASSDTVSSEEIITTETSGSAVSSESSSSETSSQSSESSSSDTESVSSNGSTSSSSQDDCYQDTYSANSSSNSTTTSSDCNTYQNYNDYMNDIMNQIAGKNCPQTPSGDVSSQSSGNVPSTSSESVSSSSPSSTDSATGTYADFQNQVLQLVNEERTSRGLNALTLDASLTKTATLKSEDMANLGYFDHNSPTYGSPFDMMKQFGISYQTAGENIAMGQTSPEQVMTGWMNSEGHRANILNASFTKLGVGIAQDSSGRYYWTQQFIG
ncbi:MAG: SCP domain-containing protein [Clostridium sp.]|jgi:uncharacterized YkwD family protein